MVTSASGSIMGILISGSSTDLQLSLNYSTWPAGSIMSLDSLGYSVVD